MWKMSIIVKALNEGWEPDWDNDNEPKYYPFEECGYDYFRAMRYSSFQYKGRKWFIKYLSSLPTVRKDSKINKFLKYIRE